MFAIASAAQLLRYRITDDPVIEKNIGRILREAERLNALVASLLDYGRPAPFSLVPAIPDDIWTDVLAAQRGALESKALLVHHTPADRAPRATSTPSSSARPARNASRTRSTLRPRAAISRITSSRRDDGTWQSRLHNDGPPVAPEACRTRSSRSSRRSRATPASGSPSRIASSVDHGGTIRSRARDGVGTTLTLTLPAGAPV